MDERYEAEPSVTLTRHDGSSIRFYRSKTNPCAFLPVQDDNTVINWVETEGTKKC